MGPGLASAQQRDGTVGYCGNADSLAAFHAPKLFFAPGERFFPTLPFVSAFDGVDNDSDGVVDLEDLDEIAPLDSLGRVDLDRLNRWAGRDSRHAVLYRVRPLAVDDRRRLARFLRADQQAWLRYGMDSVSAYLYDSMKVIEYYLFFTHDEGLEGHLLDTEKLFVFVPCSDRGRQSLRVIVGSAHDVDVPNNVLVLAGTAAAVATVYALVELGGHALAPDVDPYGSIRLGWDLNWHLGRDVWGVRDIQAIAGQGYLNGYQDWHALPRGATFAATLGRWSFGRSTDHEYVLVADSVVRPLFEWALGRPMASDGLERTLAPIRAALGTAWGYEGRLPDGAVAGALERMRHWAGGAVGTIRGGREAASGVAGKLWNLPGMGGDRDYASAPSGILKDHLFLEPRFGALISLDLRRSFPLGGGFRLRPGIGELLRGVRRLSRLAPPLPVTLWLELGLRLRPNPASARLAAAAAVEARDYRVFSWYARLDWVSRRDRLEQRDVKDASAGLGLLFRPPGSAKTRLRLGARGFPLVPEFAFTRSH